MDGHGQLEGTILRLFRSLLESDLSAIDDGWGEEIRDHRLHLSTSRYGSMIKVGGIDSKAWIHRAVGKCVFRASRSPVPAQADHGFLARRSLIEALTCR